MVLAIFFVVGVLLGLIGLRLLNHWEDRPAKSSRRSIHRHHS